MSYILPFRTNGIFNSSSSGKAVLKMLISANIVVWHGELFINDPVQVGVIDLFLWVLCKLVCS